MTSKSAHRDVALWRYERFSRGYFGFHLRAGSAEARARLRARLATLGPGASHLLHLGTGVPDGVSRPWPRVNFTDVLVTVGPAPPDGASELSLALSETELSGLLGLLDTVSPHQESCVTVETAQGAAPLWVWWDP